MTSDPTCAHQREDGTDPQCAVRAPAQLPAAVVHGMHAATGREPRVDSLASNQAASAIVKVTMPGELVDFDLDGMRGTPEWEQAQRWYAEQMAKVEQAERDC